MPNRTIRRSTHQSIQADRDRLQDLADTPTAQLELARHFVATSGNLELLRTALAVIEEAADPDSRSVLHDAYQRLEVHPERNDSGGFIRAAIVRALRPIVHPDDAPLLQRALVTYQMVGMYETAAELRGAALMAMNDLDPDLAALYAARFLQDPQNGNSGEPALSAVRLLVAQQQLAPVFAYAAWPAANSQVMGEALRLLIDLPESMVSLLIASHRDSDDEQLLLGLFDLLLAHPQRAHFASAIEQFLRTTGHLDLYGLVAMQIVASRETELIDLLRQLEADEPDHLRRSMLQHALSHA